MSDLDFISFVKNNHIIESIVSTTLSFKTNELVDSFWKNIAVQFINIDKDNDGKADIQELEKLKIEFFGIKLFIGKFFITLIKFITILLIVYYFNKIFKNVI